MAKEVWEELGSLGGWMGFTLWGLQSGQLQTEVYNQEGLQPGGLLSGRLQMATAWGLQSGGLQPGELQSGILVPEGLHSGGLHPESAEVPDSTLGSPGDPWEGSWRSLGGP